MDGVTLLSDASAAGLTIRVDGDRLVIRGPRSSDATARALLAHKPEVIAVLTTSPNCPGARTFQHRPHPALSPDPLTALYPVPPGEEWLADSWYALRRRVIEILDPADIAERAAIMQYDGELSREEAEKLARQV